MNKELTKRQLKNCFNNAQNKQIHNKKLFAFIGNKYVLATKLLSFNQDSRWKRIFLQMLPTVKNPICVDLACGTGDITFKLAQKYRFGKIYAIDLTQNMLDIAIAKNKYSNIEFICSDMAQTSFEKNSVDLITASYALRNSSDLNATLNEINRILKTKGILAILDFCKLDNGLMQKIQYHLLKLWGSLWGIILHANPTIYAYIAESIKHYPSVKEFKKIMYNNGFELLERRKFFLGTVQIFIFNKK